MSFYFNLAILICFCVGQIVALMRGRLVGATYYLCVAPLGFAGVWYGASWGTVNTCALILIVGGGLFGSNRTSQSPPFGTWGWILFGYAAIITVIGATMWPVEAMDTISPVYGKLRAWVQIVNWALWMGASWQVALAFSAPGALKKASPYILGVGLFLSFYAYYQFFANRYGLPIVDLGSHLRHGAFIIEGERFFRPGSLVGEPKGFGAILVVWLSLLSTRMLYRAWGLWAWFLLFVFLVTLLLTSSTSAWVSAICLFGLVAYLVLRSKGSLRLVGVGVGFVPVVLLCFVVLDVVVFTNVDLWEIFHLRLILRMEQPVSDMSEIVALEVLKEEPSLGLLGTGMGGMSFFIARYLGGEQTTILFPNNGLLGMICNLGIVGVFLILASVSAGLRRFIRGQEGQDAPALALVGTAALAQTFIFPQPFITVFAFGFLWAAAMSADESVSLGEMRMRSLCHRSFFL